MFSKMMATMAGKVGAPMGLLTDADDQNKPIKPDEPTMRELLGNKVENITNAVSNPGEYVMNTVQPKFDSLTSLVQDPAAYAEQRIRMAMDGSLEDEEIAGAKRDQRMQAFMNQGLSDYGAAERAVQLPTGYFNTAQRGLI
tara:strand:+ start:294 stop:716 length:423 start_codon:yes stop_codon:yes gene_type:complete